MKMGIGALKKEAGRDFGLVCISLPKPHEPVNENTFCFKLDRERLLRAMSREGRYLLRSNMKAASPETAWEFYLLLTCVEQAFKDLKGTLSIRPIWHQLEERIEAHIFVSFPHFHEDMSGVLSPHHFAKSCTGTSRRADV